jgi:hypothetical protein
LQVGAPAGDDALSWLVRRHVLGQEGDKTLNCRREVV